MPSSFQSRDDLHAPEDSAPFQTVEPIRVLIVEDLEIVRLGLRLALNKAPGYDIVGESTEGRSALQMAVATKPDVILMDIGLPDLDGIEVTAQVKRQLPKTRIIMFTSHEDEVEIMGALGAGADGFCLKDAPFKDLAEAITAVMRGEKWMDGRLSNRASSRQPANNANALKESDIELLKLMEQGLSHEDMATQMNITTTALNLLIRRLIDKLLVVDNTRHPLEIVKKHLSTLLTHQETKVTRQMPKSDAQVVDTHEKAGKSEIREKIFQVTPTDETIDNRYHLLEPIGQGGIGIVYKGTHLLMERPVAIKILYPQCSSDLKVIKRFQQESRAVSALKHRNIVSVYDFGITDQGLPYLVMDYVAGDSLDHWMIKDGLTPYQYMDIFAQVCDALAATHMAGIVHCDLKPSNIMLDGNAKDGFVPKIVDFGLSRVLAGESDAQTRLTDSFEVTGSPLYMSPEQCEGGNLDYRTDIYSLGGVMYEAFTKKPTFDSTTPYQLFWQHINEMPKPFAEANPAVKLPPQLEAIVMRCLSKKPDARYISAMEIKNELARLLMNI